jgi:hypothetical protein
VSTRGKPNTTGNHHGWPDEQTRALLTDRVTADPDEAVRQAAVQALAGL